MKPYIYFLSDPLEPNHKRYIGMTMSVKNSDRPLRHLEEALETEHHNHKIRWILKLQSEKRMYLVTKIEEFLEGTPKEIVIEAERRHIAKAKEDGHRLTNSTEGGEGQFNPSEETRAKLRAAWTSERKEEHKLIASLTHTGKIVSLETRAKYSKTVRGKIRKNEKAPLEDQLRRAKERLRVYELIADKCEDLEKLILIQGYVNLFEEKINFIEDQIFELKRSEDCKKVGS